MDAVLPAACGVSAEVETVTAEDGEIRGGSKLVMSVSFTCSPQYSLIKYLCYTLKKPS